MCHFAGGGIQISFALIPKNTKYIKIYTAYIKIYTKDINKYKAAVPAGPAQPEGAGPGPGRAPPGWAGAAGAAAWYLFVAFV